MTTGNRVDLYGLTYLVYVYSWGDLNVTANQAFVMASAVTNGSV
jgi:hypothetical protein